MNTVLLATAYFPPIEFYHHLASASNVLLEQHEHFIKQTFRNRSCILGANGKLDLSVPLQKYANNTPIRNIKISYDTDWQKQHWRSIVSAYNSSPFFMYYDYELEPFFQKRYDFLWDLNFEIIEKLNKLLKISIPISLTPEFQAIGSVNSDFRYSISPKIKSGISFKTYTQVFDQKFGFVDNLCILDLLFNEGPESKQYL